MRLFRRRHQHPRVTVIVDGIERPIWALRAGQLIVATNYDVGARRMTVRVRSSQADVWLTTADDDSVTQS